MLSSMFAGVSGLTAHQRKMDVIGNNIANVNTTAFKSSSVTFQEMFAQTIRDASQPTQSGLGGINPQQVGLGVDIGSISVLFEGGSIQTTSNPNNLAIDGDGFFVVSDGTQNRYTRAGDFDFDVAGNMVTSNGSRVMGWNLGTGTSISTTGPLQPITLAGITMPAHATQTITVTGNINSSTEIYDAVNDENFVQTDLWIYDSLGEAHSITLKIMKTAANTYNYSVLENDSTMSITSGATGGQIVFGGGGKLSSSTTPALTIAFTNGASSITIPSENIVFDTAKFTQYANATDIDVVQDGYTSGEMNDFGIDKEGKIIGVFSNGKQQHVATVAMASFVNVSGLQKVGNNEYVSTWNSGDAQIGMAGTGGKGYISTYSLEMSNVDLANEFTDMIIAQRGFQANSRIITTADQMLEELVNLKR